MPSNPSTRRSSLNRRNSFSSSLLASDNSQFDAGQGIESKFEAFKRKTAGLLGNNSLGGVGGGGVDGDCSNVPEPTSKLEALLQEGDITGDGGRGEGEGLVGMLSIELPLRNPSRNTSPTRDVDRRRRSLDARLQAVRRQPLDPGVNTGDSPDFMESGTDSFDIIREALSPERPRGTPSSKSKDSPRKPCGGRRSFGAAVRAKGSVVAGKAAGTPEKGVSRRSR